MYGGARMLSPDHPVLVRRHFRASWGSRKGRTPRPSKMIITDDPVADVVNAVAAASSRRRGGRRRRRVSKMVITDDPVADVVNAVAAASSRRQRRQARRAARNAARPPLKLRLRRMRTRNNVYWVRNENGVRVPVRSRPVRTSVTTTASQ